jgi:hypothetical protein
VKLKDWASFFRFYNRIHVGCVMIRVLASSAVERAFEPRSGETKEYKIGICCFSAKARSIKEKEQRLVG